MRRDWKIGWILSVGVLCLFGCGTQTSSQESADSVYTATTDENGVLRVSEDAFIDVVTEFYHNPDQYLGKQAELIGLFDLSYDGVSNTYCYSIYQTDAEDLCTYGVELDGAEFTGLRQDHRICVTGTLDSYEAGGNEYLILHVSSWEKLS